MLLQEKLGGSFEYPIFAVAQVTKNGRERGANMCSVKPVAAKVMNKLYTNDIIH
jgi:hypothetical protein